MRGVRVFVHFPVVYPGTTKLQLAAHPRLMDDGLAEYAGLTPLSVSEIVEPAFVELMSLG